MLEDDILNFDAEWIALIEKGADHRPASTASLPAGCLRQWPSSENVLPISKAPIGEQTSACELPAGSGDEGTGRSPIQQLRKLPQPRPCSGRDRTAKPMNKAPVNRRPKPGLISEDDLAVVLDHIENWSKVPASDSAMILLSIRAGLIPAELVLLDTRDLISPTGEILDHITIEPRPHGRGLRREIPVHWQLRDALLRFFNTYPDAERISCNVTAAGFLFYRTLDAVTQRFKWIYSRAGLYGCTSLSGRRSFAYGLACLGVPSLDIYRMLGHRGLPASNLAGNPDGISAELINSLGNPS